MRGLIFAGAAALAVAIGAFLFLHPSTPPLREAFTAPLAPIDERMGAYRTADGSVLLLAPSIEGGLQLFDVSRWSYSRRFAADGAALGGADENDGTLSFSEDGLRVEKPDGETLRARRLDPQPYSLRQVATATDAPLAGWLFDPVSDARLGAVILHGSGDSDRANTWYVYLAHRLAAEGVAAILPDKRGSGRSGGDWRAASFATLAGDGAAWLAELQRLKPGLRSGFVGVSQGGSIAPLASQMADADYAVALSAAGLTLREQLRAEISNDVRAAGVPDFLNPPLTAAYAARARGRYADFWRANGDYDMLAQWRRWGGPFFVAYGRDDEQDNIPVARSLDRLETEFADAPMIRWAVYDGAGHALVGSDDMFVPAFWADLSDFLTP